MCAHSKPPKSKPRKGRFTRLSYKAGDINTTDGQPPCIEVEWVSSTGITVKARALNFDGAWGMHQKYPVAIRTETLNRDWMRVKKC